MFEKAKTFVREHPWETAGIVFVVGVILIYLFWPRSGGKAQADSGLGPYYNAQAAAVQAGADVYGQQIQANAAVAAQKNQLDAQIAAVTAAAGVQNHAADTELAAIQAELATVLSGKQSDNQTAALLGQLSAGVSNNQTAAALQSALAQVNEQGHAVDVAANTQIQTSTLAASVQKWLSDNATTVALNTNATNYATATYQATIAQQIAAANASAANFAQQQETARTVAQATSAGYQTSLGYQFQLVQAAMAKNQSSPVYQLPIQYITAG